MAKGTVVMMLLFVSVVYEKTAVPFETTVGRPLVPLPSIPMAESLMDEGGGYYSIPASCLVNPWWVTGFSRISFSPYYFGLFLRLWADRDGRRL